MGSQLLPPLQRPTMHSPEIAGVQLVPKGAEQVTNVSLHTLAHCGPPAHGSPECVHTPPVHVSPPLQKVKSSHEVPFGSDAVQLSAASLHDSAQLPSPSGPGHGLPPCTHAPPLQTSAPLQNKPSLHAEPFGSGAAQFWPASLHDSAQLPSPSGPGHGLPVCTLQVPPPQVSVPLQNSPSVHALPFGSAKRQLSFVSLHDSLQLPSPSGPGHGSPG